MKIACSPKPNSTSVQVCFTQIAGKIFTEVDFYSAPVRQSTTHIADPKGHLQRVKSRGLSACPSVSCSEVLILFLLALLFPGQSTRVSAK